MTRFDSHFKVKMNKSSLACGLVLLISLLGVIETYSRSELEHIVTETLKKVNELENESNLEFVKLVYTMSTSDYLQADIEIMENKVKTFCVLTINEQFYMDHAGVELRCIPHGGGNNKMIIISSLSGQLVFKFPFKRCLRNFCSLFHMKASRRNLIFSIIQFFLFLFQTLSF